MFHVKTLNTREKGQIGEDIACKWLENKGFLIVERNYSRKWGEIDIVAKKDKILHFIEVKSLIGINIGHRPEENVHNFKQKRLKRAIQTFLVERGYGLNAPFQFHVISIEMGLQKEPKISFLENIIL